MTVPLDRRPQRTLIKEGMFQKGDGPLCECSHPRNLHACSKPNGVRDIGCYLYRMVQNKSKEPGADVMIQQDCPCTKFKAQVPKKFAGE